MEEEDAGHENPGITVEQIQQVGQVRLLQSVSRAQDDCGTALQLLAGLRQAAHLVLQFVSCAGNVA